MAVIDNPMTFGRPRLDFASQGDIDEFVEMLGKYERGDVTPEEWRRFRLLRGEGASDWQPLVTLARLPHIDGVSCEARYCTIKGRDLFLIDAVDGTPGFQKPTVVAQGFTGSSLQVPATRDGRFYIRLRDARDQAVILNAS